MVAVVKQTYLDMALKLRAVKDRMGYSDVVIAALEQYVGVTHRQRRNRSSLENYIGLS
jgi:hypothetical protein